VRSKVGIHIEVRCQHASNSLELSLDTPCRNTQLRPDLGVLIPLQSKLQYSTLINVELFTDAIK
jgi:hypothetical protein